MCVSIKIKSAKNYKNSKNYMKIEINKIRKVRANIEIVKWGMRMGIRVKNSKVRVRVGVRQRVGAPPARPSSH